MIQFEVWLADVQYDEGTGFKERPIVILGAAASKIICLKCTTQLATNIPIYKLDYRKCGLVKPTAVEFKRQYVIPQEKLLNRIGKLSFSDILEILSMLRLYSPLETKQLEDLAETSSQGQILKRGDLA